MTFLRQREDLYSNTDIKANLEMADSPLLCGLYRREQKQSVDYYNRRLINDNFTNSLSFKYIIK